MEVRDAIGAKGLWKCKTNPFLQHHEAVVTPGACISLLISRASGTRSARRLGAVIAVAAMRPVDSAPRGRVRAARPVPKI